MASIRRAVAPLVAQVLPQQHSQPCAAQSPTHPTLSIGGTAPSIAVSAKAYSTSSSGPKLYEFEQIKKISAEPAPDRILIGKMMDNRACEKTSLTRPDVREPSEFNDGYIPTAINLPIKSQPDALFLPEEEFEDRFGFEKPSMDKEVVFYCKSGVRCKAAAALAQQHGYQNVSEYRGSWLDWQEKGGPASKP